jgi:hypothetical protein
MLISIFKQKAKAEQALEYGKELLKLVEEIIYAN